MDINECNVGDTVWKPAIIGTITDKRLVIGGPKVRVEWKPGAPFAKQTESWEDPKDLTLVYSEEETHVVPRGLNLQDKVKKRGGLMSGKVVHAGIGKPRRVLVDWGDTSLSEWIDEDRLVLLEKAMPEVEPSWNDVQPGDKVTFEYLGETFTATAHPSNIGAAWTCVLGTAVAAWKDGRLARLISIEKPQPPLPGEGVVIQLKNGGTLAHRRRVNGLWINDRGSIYTDAEVQEIGWEVAS